MEFPKEQLIKIFQAQRTATAALNLKLLDTSTPPRRWVAVDGRATVALQLRTPDQWGIYLIKDGECRLLDIAGNFHRWNYEVAVEKFQDACYWQAR